MTELMYDSTDATQIPRDARVVAGYGDGLFIWSPSWKAAGGLPAGSNWWTLFPTAVQLVIVVSPADAGDVLDVENGDALPTDVPGWVRHFDRPARRRPTVYSSRDTWPAVVSALQAAGLSAASVDWWAATLDGTQSVAGAVAVQYQDTGTYDVSVIQDPSWVGGAAVDPLELAKMLVRLVYVSVRRAEPESESVIDGWAARLVQDPPGTFVAMVDPAGAEFSGDLALDLKIRADYQAGKLGGSALVAHHHDGGTTGGAVADPVAGA